MFELLETGHRTCLAETLAGYSRVVECEILRGLCTTQEWFVSLAEGSHVYPAILILSRVGLQASDELSYVVGLDSR